MVDNRGCVTSCDRSNKYYNMFILVESMFILVESMIILVESMIILVESMFILVESMIIVNIQRNTVF